MTIITIVTDLLSYLTFFSDIGIVIFLLALTLYGVKHSRKKFFSQPTIRWIGKRGVLIAFIVAAVATVGSLFFSEIAQYEPCKLCWFQRIFMYPQVILLSLALEKKDRYIIPYSLVMVYIGGLIALYHYYIQLSPAGAFVPCSTVGISVSCTSREFTHLGYITIPMMSLTAFTLIGLSLWISKKTHPVV